MRTGPALIEPRDLAILGLEQHWLVSRMRLTAMIGCLAGCGVGVVVISRSRVPNGLGAAAAIVTGTLALIAWQMLAIRRRAASARNDADLAVSAFLDLVTIMLAGGAGLETALVSAASCGDGWVFSRIRDCLARAQSSRRDLWTELREWGRASGIESLVEMANSVEIAGEHGARIRASLIAKSRSLRSRNIARIEHEAGRRTEQMGLPIVAMFIGFVVFVSYPALMGTVGQF